MPKEVTNTCRSPHTCQKLFMWRFFAAKQKLSKRLRAKQFQVISVDHVALKRVPILRIDISKAHQRKVLEELILLDKVLYVHLAPPCGT